jgi:hypothetical protein
MRCFARALAQAESGETLLIAWLTGLLEAEGTFLQPSPSGPGLPMVACQMTDQDVIERVAAAFGTTVTAIPREGRRMMYGTRIKGSRATILMRDLEPAMGERRAQSIKAALDAHAEPSRKLSFLEAEAMRELHAGGVSISSLARRFLVSRPTVRQVLERSIYGVHPAASWRHLEPRSAGAEISDSGGEISQLELHWLAGWLEGEGSFLRPPPSDRRRARIMATTRDADVAAEVGRLLRVTPRFSHDERERQRGWSPTWRLLKRGRGAVLLMRGVHPLMGLRRQSQIDSALAALS